MYERNLEMIKKKDAVLYKAITASCASENAIKCEVVVAKDGTNITKIIKDEKVYFMNSQYRPEMEAVKFSEQYGEIIDYSVMFFLGFGNGIIANKVREKLPEHVTMLFYEPSIELFLHALYNFDLTTIFDNENTIVMIKGLNDKGHEDIMASLVRYDNYRICIYDALPKYRQIFPEEYSDLEMKYRYVVNQVQSNICTMQDFGSDIARNNIYNMRYLFQSNCMEDFEGAFPTEMPAIIVAAGPSLEKNVQLLKKAKGKAFIIAVDTALGYLMEQGIQPDLAVTVDPRKPIRLFQNEKVREIPLAMYPDSNYQIMELYAGRKTIFVSNNCEYYNEIFSLAGKKLEFLNNGGSVATVAFSMARKWGFRRIVLVGQDLALTEEKVHAGKDDIDHHKLTANKIIIDGYYGDKVATSRDFDEYRKWYELVIRAVDGLEIINATEGGGRIAGAVQMSLQEVIDTFCNCEFDFEETIRKKEPIFTAGMRLQILKKWNESICNLEKIRYKLKEAQKYIEKGLNLVQQGMENSDKLRKTQKKIDRLVKECEEINEIYFIDCMIAKEQEDVLGDIYESETIGENEYQRLLEKLKQYIQSMLLAVDEVKSMFEKIIEDTRQIEMN